MRTSLFGVVVTSLIACAANADDLTDLAIFKSGGIQSGLWRMEVLESSSLEMQKMMQQAGKLSICADLAKQLAKGEPQNDAESCTPRILSNKANAAEIEVTCEDGDRSLVKFFKEGARSYVADIDNTPKKGESRHFKLRYSYEGECQGDSMIQLDKDSEACKQMGDVDLASMCSKAPEQYRAQCEQQAKQMAGMCQ